jgi:hypothetical protein
MTINISPLLNLIKNHLFQIFVIAILITGCSKNGSEEIYPDAPESAPAEEAPVASVDGVYGTKGYFLINGEKFEYDLVKVEGNSMFDVQGDDPNNLVTAYGYISFFGDIPNDAMKNLSFSISPGKIYKSGDFINITSDLDLMFDVNVTPQNMNEQEFKQIKMTLLKSKDAKAFVKIQGRFNLYRDSFRLYIDANKLEIIDAKKD